MCVWLLTRAPLFLYTLFLQNYKQTSEYRKSKPSDWIIFISNVKISNVSFYEFLLTCESRMQWGSAKSMAMILKLVSFLLCFKKNFVNHILIGCNRKMLDEQYTITVPIWVRLSCFACVQFTRKNCKVELNKYRHFNLPTKK